MNLHKIAKEYEFQLKTLALKLAPYHKKFKDELIRIIESHLIINEIGGLYIAKANICIGFMASNEEYGCDSNTPRGLRIRQAIEDVEKCDENTN